jgi:hypothetical protein
MMTQYPDKVWCLMHKGVFQTTAPIKDQLVWEWREFVLPAADLSSPLGAVAMRDACKDKVTSGTTLLRNCGMGDIADLLTDHAADFDTIPLPDHTALLAAAMRLPEVAALREALQALRDAEAVLAFRESAK